MYIQDYMLFMYLYLSIIHKCMRMIHTCANSDERDKYRACALSNAMDIGERSNVVNIVWFCMLFMRLHKLACLYLY